MATGPARRVAPPVPVPPLLHPGHAVPDAPRTRSRGSSNAPPPPALLDQDFLEETNRVLVISMHLPVTIDLASSGAPGPETMDPAGLGGTLRRRGARTGSDVQGESFSTEFSPASFLLGKQEPLSESVASLAPPSPRRRSDGRTAQTDAGDSPSDSPAEPPADFRLLPATVGNHGLRNAVASVPQLRSRSLWVGALSNVSTELASASTLRAISDRLLAEASSVPVFLDDEQYHGAYEVFCRQVLWKVMHYEVDEVPKGQTFDLKYWEAYVAVNRLFASVVSRLYQPGDVLWVNDYHLMLLPSMLRQLLPQATIGFYLHIPFPSSEIFRCLHVRKQVLEGILGADLVGFQNYSYLRHFLVSVNRLLSLDSTPRGIQLPETVVSVGIFPIGIDVAALQERRRNPEVDEHMGKLLRRHAGRRLIVGREKLDSTKGYIQKLLAFETFLDLNPEFVGKVTLIQVAVPAQSDPDLEAAVGDCVSRIQGRFGSIGYLPVVYLKKDIDFSMYLGLLAAADACIITSLRDGQNLTSHEFVVMQEARKSPLILSEFAGAYSGFGAALRCNPWDQLQVADKIREALTMPADEKEARWEELYGGVLNASAQSFVTGFLSELNRVHRDVQSRYRTNIPKLDVASFVEAWNAAKGMRLLFIDQDGTLFPSKFLKPVGPQASGVRDALAPSAAEAPSEFSPARLADLLADLRESDRNTVFVMSGRRRDQIDEGAPPDAFDGVGLCAENGCFFRFPDEEWEALVEPDSLHWKKPVLDIIGYFNDRTAGAQIQVREASIVWDFANVEPQFGQRQAAECANQISGNVGVKFPVHCLIKRGRLEVLPNFTDKGAVVKRVLERYQSADLVLIVGDDIADEPMFETAEAFIGANAPPGEERRRSSTTTSTALSDIAEDVWGAADMSPQMDGIPSSAGRRSPAQPPPIRLGDAHGDSAMLMRRATLSSYLRLVPTTFITVTNGAKSTKARYFCSGTNEVWELLRAAVAADRKAQEETVS
ncbi:glycosyltransferase family 20-domain-containing protein [Hyaloraphidium curvatum]|nr:glycosyltransferase family 20-domain-containing protein [Hyaloraphidium curvatum]